MATTTPPPPSLPLISLPPLLSPTPTSAKFSTARALLSSLRTHGFLYLTDIDPLIPPPLLSQVFHQSSLFFALPLARKNALAWTTPRSNRGYTAPGREKTSTALTVEEVARQRAGEGQDRKESYEVGREGVEGCENRWPGEENGIDGESKEQEQGDSHNPTPPLDPTTFRATLLNFHTLCASLHRTLLDALALALDLSDPNYFHPYTRKGDNTLRLLHYPSMPASTASSSSSDPQTNNTATPRIRAGAHTDYGTLTLLFQDAAGGLQVAAPDSSPTPSSSSPTRTTANDHDIASPTTPPPQTQKWLNVPPLPHTIVVNAGDLLARWMNGGVRSTLHRVVEPSLPTPVPPPSSSSSSSKNEEVDNKKEEIEKIHPPRYSIAYFCNPDADAWIEAIPGTFVEGGGDGEGGKKWPGVRSGTYLEERLGVTY